MAMTAATDVQLISARCARAASEIAALANSNIPDTTFVRTALEKLVDALEARAAALWCLSPQGVLALGCDVRLAETGVTRDPARSGVNIARLLDVTGKREATIHVDAGSRGDETPSLAVLIAPVAVRKRCLGAVEVFLPGELPSTDRLDALQFVEEVCGSIAYYLAWREEAASAGTNLEFWDRFDRIVAQLHQSLDSRQIAMMAVNEGRRLLGCDRVSLVIQRGARTDVVAVSGQERVNRSSNLVRSLAELSAPAVRSNRPLSSGSNATLLPPSIEQLVLNHLKIGGARLVNVFPLEAPPPAAQVTPGEGRPGPPSRAFAALVIEQFTDSRLSPLALARAVRYSGHVANALHNAITHERVFLLSLRRAVGRCGSWLRGRTLAKLALALIVLAGTIGALAFVPARFRVEGKGKLMPAVQSHIFAPWDGEVTEVLVAGGNRVKAGQPLVQVHNDELQSQLLAAQNRLAEKQQQLDALQAEIGEANRRVSRADDLVRLRGRLAQTRIELDGATERAAAIERQIAELTVCSPIAGTVASFQIEQSLLNRPVRRGDVLLEVMDENDAWRLEITVPEHRLGHLLAALRRHPGSRLAAEFVLATTPEETYDGEVDLVATRTDVLPEQGAVVDVHIAVDAAGIKNRRIGAEAVVKIDCGKRSLAYVLFGDAVEFLQRRLW